MCITRPLSGLVYETETPYLATVVFVVSRLFCYLTLFRYPHHLLASVRNSIHARLLVRKIAKQNICLNPVNSFDAVDTAY